MRASGLFRFCSSSHSASAKAPIALLTGAPGGPIVGRRGTKEARMADKARDKPELIEDEALDAASGGTAPYPPADLSGDEPPEDALKKLPGKRTPPTVTLKRGSTRL